MKNTKKQNKWDELKNIKQKKKEKKPKENGIKPIIGKTKKESINNQKNDIGEIEKISKKYVAGFFDGEGCISIQKTKPPNRNNSPQYQLQCSVGQKRKKVLELIKSKYGGHIYKRNNFYEYRLICDKARYFLKDIKPYLIVKKEEAIIGLDFAKECNIKNKNKRIKNNKSKGYRHVPEYILKIREEKYIKLKKLHHY